MKDKKCCDNCSKFELTDIGIHCNKQICGLNPFFTSFLYCDDYEQKEQWYKHIYYYQYKKDYFKKEEEITNVIWEDTDYNKIDCIPIEVNQPIDNPKQENKE